MLLNRLGNKKVLVRNSNILELFPEHTTFIDMFFGAGGLFFKKPKAKYNICNDADSEVFNLFQVVSTRQSELEQAVYRMPYHSDLLKYWKANTETDPVMKAVRFLMMSNFTFMGKGETLRFITSNTKSILYENIDKTSKFIFDVQFMNYDFRKVISKIGFTERIPKSQYFIYADPPYLGTVNNYAANCQFTQTDTEDLFEVLVNSGIRFAISEFDNPVILDLARQHGLQVISLGDRRNLGNRRNEVLIVNYETQISQHKLELL